MGTHSHGMLQLQIGILLESAVVLTCEAVGRGGSYTSKYKCIDPDNYKIIK